MRKRNVCAIIIFVILLIWLYFNLTYKIVKIRINNKIEYFFLPKNAKLHLYKNRLQYTKSNGWNQSIYYNVENYEIIK